MQQILLCHSSTTIVFVLSPDPAPRGGITGPCPPKWLPMPPKRKLCPPSEECAPKKLTGSGLLEWKSRRKLVFFVDWHRISWRFWDEDLFFWRSPVFGGKNCLNLISACKPLVISEKTFILFFEDHLFSTGKTAWISDYGREIPLNLCSSPCSFGPDWDKFLVPPFSSRVHPK